MHEVSTQGSKKNKLKLKQSFHFKVPTYFTESGNLEQKYIGTFEYFLDFPLSPNFNVVPG